jgi:16S rRNA (guanine966-N2)-methyltransferase
MRERVFSVLAETVIGASFLDLYAGTGAVGLEALSRGAASVVSVDSHPAAIRLVEANRAALCPEPGTTRIVQATARAAVASLARRGERFQLVWADPPFELWRDGLEALVAAFEHGVVDDDGLACLECPQRAGVAGSLADDLEIVRDLVGGASRVVVLARAVRDSGTPAGARTVDE